MIELVVFAALAFCFLVVVGTLVAAGSLVGWLIALPFRILGFLLGGVGLVLALPFVLLAALVAAVALGIGAFLLFIPAAPFLVIAFALVWLLRRSPRRAAPTH